MINHVAHLSASRKPLTMSAKTAKIAKKALAESAFAIFVSFEILVIGRWPFLWQSLVSQSGDMPSLPLGI